MEKLKNVNLIETNEPYNKVLYWFFSFPDISIGLNELSSKVKISKSNANRVVNRLEKEGFLIKEVIGKSWRIKCNKNNIYNKSKKLAFNLQLIYDSDILSKVNKKFPNAQAIILFGSYRKGDDIDKSDIDIAINLIGNNQLKIEELGTIEKFGNRKNVMVNLYIFCNQEIKNNLFSNIVNGIVLDGFLEVKQ
jgi:predicted nucleotidyltransferase